MGASASIPSSTHVVVVGGNIGGCAAAAALEKKGARVTVIEPKDRLYVAFGGVRAGVLQNFEDQLLIPYDRVFKSPANKFVRAYATGVDEKARTVSFQPLDADGHPSGPASSVGYDFLILATGSVYGGPPMKALASRGELKATLAAVCAAVKAAGKVVVVGGGATGIELAGEIKHAYPGKVVTLLHRSSALLSEPSAGLTPKFQARIGKEVVKAGIVLHTNARVDVEAVKTAPGVSTVAEGYYAGEQVVQAGGAGGVAADLVILATGAQPCTAWMKGSSLEGRLDKRGFVQVELTYQVKDAPRVFAIGDCAGSPDAKAGWLIDTQIKVVVGNIAKLAGTKNVEAADVKLVQQKKPLNGMGVVPVGPKHGAGLIPGLGIVSFIVPMKAKHFFADVIGPKMGYTIAELRKVNAVTA